MNRGTTEAAIDREEMDALKREACTGAHHELDTTVAAGVANGG